MTFLRSRHSHYLNHRFLAVGFLLTAPLTADVPLLAAAPVAAATGMVARRADPGNLPDHYAQGIAFLIPAGWRLEAEANGTTALIAPNAPTGQSAKIVIAAPDKAYSSVRQSLEADVAEARNKTNNFREENDVEEMRHPAGYAMARQAVSWSSGAFSGDNGLSPFGRLQVVLYHLDNGPQQPAQPVMLVTSSRALLDTHRATFDAWVRDVRLARHVVLAPGKSGQEALTLHTAHQFDAALEWLLDSTFTAAQRSNIHRFLIGAWERGDENEMRGVRELPETQAKVEALPEEQRGLVRQAMRTEALKGWRAEAKAGDAGAKIVLALYEAAQKPLVPGTPDAPPLTREVAEATLDTLYFMASMSVNPSGPEIRPTAVLREKWISGFIAEWKTLSAAQKEAQCALPGLAASLRLAWQRMSASEKTKGAVQWAKIEPVKVIAQQIKAEQASTRTRGGLNPNSSSSRAQNQVNLYNQLSAYGALRINHTYIKW